MYSGELTPFHDRAAISLVIQLAAHLRPDLVVWGGDVLDLADQSDKFLRSPELRYTTQPAIVEAAWVIASIDQYTKKSVVIEGNHDRRLYTSLLSHFDHAYDLKPANKLKDPPPMSVESLLGLKDLGIQYIGDYPHGRYPLNDKLHIVHGDLARAQPGATAKGLLEREHKSIAFGHIHRRELVSRNLNANGHPEVITAFTPGCLCRIDGVVPGSKPGQSWQQGIAIVDYDDDNFDEAMIPIKDGYCYFNGSHFVAKDYTRKLHKLDFFK
jgi:hypothetical protein